MGFKELKRFAKNVVGRFTIGPDDIQVGLITFANNSVIQFNLNTYKNKAEIVNAINSIPYSTGMTYTNKALEHLIKFGFSQYYGGRGGFVPKIAIIISDGGSREPLKTMQLVKKARN